MARKRRVDRNHVVYQVTCKPTGERYIGITVANGRAYKRSIHTRWIKHVHRAVTERARLPLSCAIRTHGRESFTHEVIAVVRGKSEAHARELELIKKVRPELNQLGIV